MQSGDTTSNGDGWHYIGFGESNRVKRRVAFDLEGHPLKQSWKPLRTVQLGLAGVSVRACVSRAESERDGTFTIRMQPEDEAGWVWFESEDYCRVGIRTPAREPGAYVEARLPRATRVPGTIRDANGKPVSGASVSIERLNPVFRPRGWPEEWLLQDGSRGAGSSDEHGCFSIAGVLPGATYRLRAADRELGTSEWRTVCIRAGDAQPVDLTLPGDVSRPNKGTIRGRFRFGGEPAIAVVRVQPRAGNELKIRTGSKGELRVDYVPQGQVLLRFIPAHLDSLPADRREAFEVRRTLEVRGGQVVDVEIEGCDGVAYLPIAGRVVRAGGGAAARVAVHVQCAGSVEPMIATTRYDGSFELPLPAALGEVEVFAAANPDDRRRATPGDRSLVFGQPPPGRLRYRVAGLARGRDPLVFFRRAGGQWTRKFAPGPSDPEGWRLLETPPGLYDFASLDLEAGGAPTLVRGVTIGVQPTELTLQMVRGTRVTFRLAPDAMPLPGVGATLVEEGFDPPPNGIFGTLLRCWRGIPLDDPGAVTLHAVAPGRHRLVASYPTVEILPAVVEVGGSGPAELELRWRRRQ